MSSSSLQASPRAEDEAAPGVEAEAEAEDRLGLQLEPRVELHIVEALCAKFHSVIKGYCDLSLFRWGKREKHISSEL